MARTAATFCSYRCAGKAKTPTLLAHAYDATGKPGMQRYGAANPAWKGGVTFKRSKGNYIGPKYVRCPADLLPMARSDGYILEHRLIVARWVGRPLLRTEVVNHINHVTSDNRRENLELYPSNADHKRGEVGRFVEGVANHVYLPG